MGDDCQIDFGEEWPKIVSATYLRRTTAPRALRPALLSSRLITVLNATLGVDPASCAILPRASPPRGPRGWGHNARVHRMSSSGIMHAVLWSVGEPGRERPMSAQENKKSSGTIQVTSTQQRNSLQLNRPRLSSRRQRISVKASRMW